MIRNVDLDKMISVKNIQKALEYYGYDEGFPLEKVLEEMIHVQEADWR